MEDQFVQLGPALDAEGRRERHRPPAFEGEADLIARLEGQALVQHDDELEDARRERRHHLDGAGATQERPRRCLGRMDQGGGVGRRDGRALRTPGAGRQAPRRGCRRPVPSGRNRAGPAWARSRHRPGPFRGRCPPARPAGSGRSRRGSNERSWEHAWRASRSELSCERGRSIDPPPRRARRQSPP